MIAGVVLAGGRSTRFGSEKAVADVEGRPMIAHVASALARGCGQLAVNAPDQSGAADWARRGGLPVLTDAPALPDGPLTGVLAGLDWAAAQGAEALATAPCDTPWLPRTLVTRLALARGDRLAATSVTAEGSHPLCTLWSLRLREPLRAELSQGRHPSVRGWLERIGAAPVRFRAAARFANLNRSADLSRTRG